MTSFIAVEEVDHLFLLVLEEGLSSEPKYQENFSLFFFIILFTCLSLCRQDQFAVLIFLFFFFFLRGISLYTCKSKYLAERLDSTSTQKHTTYSQKLWNLTVNSQNRIIIIIITIIIITITKKNLY